ncbi:MAG TPA: nucleoside deaminase [Oscillatoriales cyanobacterium M59_W2019_021]|nr:MAG: nucleoside deaminase [Cyanobacteria bacterium J055]HIK30347.1 nucleoside deaminase [Oscillatoriales cyanobacterium M4454_W2019_049]HIK49591.1 nucleoside deaminase [Oscillatoriales cyanobacterium M59_W2019_021]
MDEFMAAAAIATAHGRLAEGGISIASVSAECGRIGDGGNHRRVRNGDSVTHANIECWQNAGCIGSYEDTILSSTLMPGYLRAGAVVQFGIPKASAGESATVPGVRQWMEFHGVEVVDFDLEECKQLRRQLIGHSPQLWNEDIGK